MKKKLKAKLKKNEKFGKMLINDKSANESLSIDELIQELVYLRKKGFAKGTEKVIFGTDFMSNCIPIKSIIMDTNLDGTITVGISNSNESEWLSKCDDITAFDSNHESTLH